MPKAKAKSKGGAKNKTKSKSSGVGVNGSSEKLSANKIILNHHEQKIEDGTSFSSQHQ